MVVLKAEHIKELARSVGFDLCGIASVRNFSAEKVFFEGWLERGYGSSLDYLGRNVEKRFSPGLLMPGARSVIVCAVNYKNPFSLGYGEGPEAAKVASYAVAPDYHSIIKGMLASLAGKLEEGAGRLSWRTFSDSAPVLEKRWALEAGLGFIGRNTLLVSPRLGSFLLLGELIVDAPVDIYDQPYRGPGCGECRRCVAACPNGALTSDGIDTRVCISRITIEKHVWELPAPIISDGTLAAAADGRTGASDVAGFEGTAGGKKDGGSPPKSAVPLHGWIYGCDECQGVCPYNAAAPMCGNAAFAPVFDPTHMSREDWLSLTEEEFRKKFGDTPLRRTGLSQIKQNCRGT